MRLPSKCVFFENYSFDIYPHVYEPAEDSFFFAQNLITRKNDFVLDVGTGCGLLSVVAAGQGSNVISVDLNPSAVLCAQANARQNGFYEKISVVRADLFGSIAD